MSFALYPIDHFPIDHFRSCFVVRFGRPVGDNPALHSLTKTMKTLQTILLTILIVSLSLGLGPAAYAQSGYGYLEDEGASLWVEGEFMDTTGMEFETTDAEYVGEDQVRSAEAAARRAGLPTIDLAAAIEQDKELMPENIVYGIGTGAVIGGWLALVQGESARENVRYVSVGVVAGVLLALAVGTKSLYQTPGYSYRQPDRPNLSAAPNRTPAFSLDVLPTPNAPLAKLNFRFSF
jgi:hypothetical protein